MPAAEMITTSQRRVLAWLAVPALLLLAWPVLVTLGLGSAQPATAATSTVVVNAAVGSVTSLSVCGATLAIPVASGGFQGATCVVNFGASNNAALPLLVEDNDNAAPFLAGGVFADDAGGCTALTGDTIGYKVDTVGLTAASNHPCATSAAATDTDYTTIPSTSTTVCTTTALVNQNCPVDLGIRETGANAAAGTYSGTLRFSA